MLIGYDIYFVLFYNLINDCGTQYYYKLLMIDYWFISDQLDFLQCYSSRWGLPYECFELSKLAKTRQKYLDFTGTVKN